jgi:hypothetical protein
VNVAFTGPSVLTFEQEVECAAYLVVDVVMHANDVWRSGCAKGVDSIVANQAVVLDLDLELYIPFAEHNDTLVRRLAPQARVIRCPRGPEPYRIRNVRMVRGADLLVAFVRSENFYRSGEWMTINIAKKQNVPVKMYVLDA